MASFKLAALLLVSLALFDLRDGAAAALPKRRPHGRLQLNFNDEVLTVLSLVATLPQFTSFANVFIDIGKRMIVRELVYLHAMPSEI